MTSMTRFLTTPRFLRRIVASLICAFSLCCAADVVYSQPPMNFPPGGQGVDGGRLDRRSGRAGRVEPDQAAVGQRQGAQGEQPAAERQVDLDTALDSAAGASPIRLNQDAFRARDNVRLTGTYYKGKGDKDTPVVILIPGLKSEEGAYTKLAQLLAQQGYGVLIPDLRNRGQDQGAQGNNPRNAQQPRVQSTSQEPSMGEVLAMIELDREVWFNFLFHVNDRGYCNVKKTIIVGSEFSAALACAWARNDWAGRGIQYQNTVGLALLSPDAVDDKDKKKKGKDEEENQTTATPQYDCLNSLEAVHKAAKGKVFGYLLVAGIYDESKLESAKLIQRKIGGVKDEEARPQDKVVLFNALSTSMQGTQLLGLESQNVAATIAQFVEKRMSELPRKRDKWEPVFQDLTKDKDTGSRRERN
jgi:hypothetical protein